MFARRQPCFRMPRFLALAGIEIKLDELDAVHLLFSCQLLPAVKNSML